MFYRQPDFYNIGELADKYGGYLKKQGCTKKEISDCKNALKVLYWQCSENAGYLHDVIKQGITDGKQFCMLLHFAWTINDSLERAATLAKIGDESKNYTTVSDTHHITTVKLYPDEKGDLQESNDYLFVRFLDSFISCHPISINEKDMVRRYLPVDSAYCLCVDYIVNEGWYKADKFDKADFKITTMYDSGKEYPISIFLKSSEIWKFFEDRFNQMTDVILENLLERTQIEYDEPPVPHVMDPIIRADPDANGSKTLYIIGNGFDINHGLPTRYTIYKEFNKSHKYSTFFWFTDLPYKRRDVQLGNDDRIWSDIESDLAIDFSKLIEDSIEYKTKENTTILDSVKLYTDRVEEFTTTNLFNWLNEYKNDPIRKKYDLPKDGLYLTFNYTDTLERTYQIPAENILHIHGYVNNVDPESLAPHTIREELQFGAPLKTSSKILEDTRLKYSKRIDEDDDLRLAFEHLDWYVKMSTKNLSSNYDKLEEFISEKGIKKIIVMGNSCWGVDFDYYKDVICPLIPNAEWVFLYFTPSDCINMERMCCKLNIKKKRLEKWVENEE